MERGACEAHAGARLTVDLTAIQANYRLIAARVAPAAAGAVVKADAYGLGAAMVAPALARAGCRDFFVAVLAEALRLQPLLPADARLYVLNGLQPGAEELCASAAVRPVLNSLEQAQRWRAVASARGARLAAAVQVDSGMSRLGLTPEEVDALAADAAFFEAVDVALVMSHLACADTPEAPANRGQLDRFNAAAERLAPHAPRSLANSAGGFAASDFHGDLVRPGLALYGAEPMEGQASGLAPVVTLEARVIQVRTIPAGAGVGYGLTYVAEGPRRIATVSLGYADGWPRRLGGKAAGWFRGVRLPIAGRISMDSMSLDVTDLPAGALKEGDFIELIGREQTLEAVAAQADTVAYEILTSLGRRFARAYRPAMEAERGE